MSLNDDIKPGAKVEVVLPKTLYADLCQDLPKEGEPWQFSENPEPWIRENALMAVYELKTLIGVNRTE